jgi:hypothetical protein
MSRHPDHARYSAYLTGHLAGASSGVAAFRAAVRTWRGTEHEAVLRQLVREISGERQELRALVDRLGYAPGPARKTLFAVAAAAGRANPLNRVRRRGRVSVQLELEELVSLVRAKHSMYETLAVLAAADHRLDADRQRELAALAASQEQRLLRIMTATAESRFLVD